MAALVCIEAGKIKAERVAQIRARDREARKMERRDRRATRRFSKMEFAKVRAGHK